MRRLVVVLAVAGGVLALPAAAFAHATLIHASPGFRERLSTAPNRVVLRFDQQVDVVAGSVEVRTASGRIVSLTPRLAGDGRRVVARVTRLPRGAYTVRWHVISGDGHVVSGVFTFGVRHAAPPPTEAYGASGPTRAEDIVRWGYFVSLALLIGGLVFRLVCLPRELPERLERRFYLLTGLGVVAVLELGIAAFLLRAEDALQLPFGRLLYGDLSPIATGTRFGEAFIAMTLGFAFVAAFVYLAWLTDRRWLLWPALALSLAFASGLSLSGHSAADAGSSWLSEAADWVHLTAASVWIGGLVHLSTVVFRTAPELRRDAFLRFSRLATALIGIVLGAGLYLSVLRLPHVRDLWSEGYGRVLLVKIGLVGVALAWGAFHHFFARPVLERRATSRLVAGLPRSLLGETAVGVAVLLAAAVLVNSKPPEQQPSAGQTASVRAP